MTGTMHVFGCPKTHSLFWNIYCIRPSRLRLSTRARRNGRRMCMQPQFKVYATAGALELPPGVIGSDVDMVQGVLPKKLRDSVAILEAPNPKAPGGKAKVYVLGLSHVSKVDCDLVADLIRRVKPTIVVLELCKDRTALLVPKERSFPLWLTDTIDFPGLPDREGWPQPSELLSLLRCSTGLAVTTRDIEDDCVTLQSTGLFKSVRPSTSLADDDAEVEQFIVDKQERLTPAIPLGKISYLVAPRELPPLTSFSVRVDSSLAESTVIPEDEVSPIAKEALEASSSGTSTVDVCLRFLPRLKDLAARHNPDAHELEVAYRGVEDGKVEAVVKKASQEYKARSYTSGLEGSASDGLGFGIEPFRIYRGPLVLGKTMRIDNVADVVDVGGEGIATAAVDLPALPQHVATAYGKTPVRDYERPEEPETTSGSENSEEGKDTAAESAEEGKDAAVPKKDILARASEALEQWLTLTYGRYNKQAGEKTGVEYGQAWRVAMSAAASAGSTQIQLGDMPESIVARRLVRGILAAVPLNLAAAVACIGSGVALQQANVIPDGYQPAVGVVVFLGVSAAVWSFVGPLVEISMFAGKTGEQIEDIVARKGPVEEPSTRTELWGEDALLKWPGARRPVIEQRDAFMARTLWAAATGAGASPAYVADIIADKPVWRYAMPEEGPQESCTPGRGQGVYQPIQSVESIVAVVGSAHIPGLLREWRTAENVSQMSDILRDE